MCELEGGKAKLDRGLSWSGGDWGWVLRGGVVLGGGNGDGRRRSRAQGGEWGLGLGGMERGGAGTCAAQAKGGGEGLVGVGHGGDGRCSGRRGLGARLWVKERIGGGVPVEAAGESRTEVAARRGGGAGVDAEAEAAHQDGSGGDGQASRRRRRGGERSRR